MPLTALFLAAITLVLLVLAVRDATLAIDWYGCYRSWLAFRIWGAGLFVVLACVTLYGAWFVLSRG